MMITGVMIRTIAMMAFLWLIGSVYFFTMDMTDKLIGFQIGSISTFIYCASLVYHLVRITRHGEKGAVREMQMNAIARVMMVTLFLLFAAKISQGTFWGCVIGIGCMYIGQIAFLFHATRIEDRLERDASGDTDK